MGINGSALGLAQKVHFGKNTQKERENVNKTKKALSVILVLCMLLGVVPMGVLSFAADIPPYSDAYVSAVYSLSLADYIQDADRRAYAETRMKQWLLSNMGNYRVYKNLSEPSSSGNRRSVVFFFDGCSDNAADPKKPCNLWRVSAACVVVQLDSSGLPYIAYYDGESSTIPDAPRSKKANGDKKGMPTLLDGIYNISYVNHKGNYAALNVDPHTNNVIRLDTTVITENPSGSSDINIHAKSTTGQKAYDNGYKWSNSTGCINVATTKDSYKKYNNFMRVVTYNDTNILNGIAVTGLSNGTTVGNKFYNYKNADAGVVIIDRFMYKDSLLKLYEGEYCDVIVESILKNTTSLPDVSIDGVPTPSVLRYPVPTIIATNGSSTQTFNVNQPINISWNALENAKSYTISAKVLDADPMCLFDSTDSESGTAISLTKLSDTSYQIPASYATAGKAIKIAAVANYEGASSNWTARYIRITPDAPSLTSFADEATVPAGEDLTVTWSGATGAQEYEYKVIELENKTPDRASDSEPARRTIISLSRTSSESFTINGEDLPSGRTFKIWLSSVGKDNTSKGQSYYFYTNGTETNNPASGISFADSAVSMTIGDTVMKRPTFTPKNTTNKSVQYTSSNTDVATVDADGIVTALAAGSTTITATAYDGGFTASYTVTVGAKATADVWYKQYNPNNNKKITPALIQQFLDNHGGSLKSYTTVNGQTKLVTPNGNLDLGFDNYYSYDNTLNTSAIKTKASGQTLSPAELIYYACVENDCNVAFILAKLQTEQSLIGQQATPEKLACASGYLKTDHTHYQPGEKFYGFVGQLIGLTHQMYKNAHNSNLLTIEKCYQNYTQDANWPFDRFENEVYSKYRAEWDTLLDETTVVSENTLDTSNQFEMITPSQEKQIIPAGALTLEWTDCKNADYYMVSMRDVTDGENDSADKQILNRQRVDDPDNQYTIAASYFKNGGTYKIAVGAYMNSVIHDKGYEKWITPYTYVTVSDSTSLGCPAFVSPVNNTQVAENTPVTVHWSAANGADFYNINMRDLTTDTKVIDARNVGDAKSFTIPVSENGMELLLPGHRYRVAVEAATYSGDSRWADPHLQFSVAGDVPQQDLAEHLTTVPAGFTGIYTADDLQTVRNNLSDSYILMNDIDMTGNGNWTPVGTAASAFKGVFNGNGYSIKNMSAASSTIDSVGLFGCSEGTVANLNLSISSSGNWCVGGIAGTNKGSIQDCMVNGAIRNNSSQFDQTNGHSGSYVGGICGTNLGTITSCISSVSTVASGSDVPNGGLAGQNYAGGTIQTSYASGNVNGGVAGGLVGLNNAAHLEQDALIENCYALGNVNGTVAGGLVGRCRNHSTEYSSKGIVRNSYASNYVVGSNQDYVGGIVGDVACNYEVSRCYYDSDISTCTDTNKGSPRNNTQMQSASTFTGWAMGSVWNVAANVNNGYPYLRGIEAINRNLSGDKASDFTYKLTDNNKTVQITGYQGTRVDVTIPAIVEGKPVTSIATEAFANNNDLITVSLPDTLQTIYESAFNNCRNLSTVNLGNGVRTINRFAFGSCVSLKSITIPKSITTLRSQNSYYNYDDGAFENSGLTIVVHEFSVTNIPATAFKNCKQLQTVIIPGSAKTIGSKAFYNCSALTNVTIQNGVETIGTSAFQNCTSLAKIVFPDSITTVQEYAFNNCGKLSDVNLGNGLKAIERFGFGNCPSLTTITIPKTITILRSESGYYNYDDGAFENSGLTSITFESGVAGIPATAFKNCKQLQTVVIPGSAKVIGSKAFYNCSALTNVTIQNGVESIGASAFQNCTSLAKIVFPDSMTTVQEYAFNSCGKLSNVNLGNGLKTIERFGFGSCPSLTTITIPKTITTLRSESGYYNYDDGAFENSGLTSVTFESGVAGVSATAFKNCKKLETISIPDGVTTIGTRAFQNCTALSRVVLPDSLTEIQEYAFLDCTALSTVKLGNGLQTIQRFGFKNCVSLTTITIPKSIATLRSQNSYYNYDDGAFENSGLTSVEFESGLTTIPATALKNCKKLEVVIIPGSVTSIGNNCFLNSTEKLTIYGNSGSFAEEYAADNTIPFQSITSATGVQLHPSAITLYPTEEKQVIATVLPENAVNPIVTWRSLNPSVATVSGSGLVTAITPGTAKIKVTSSDGGWIAYCDVTVAEPSISFQTSQVYLQVDDTFKLEVTTAPEGRNFAWRSSNASVAYVRGGVITAESNGTATITATMEYGGKTYSAECIVTVGNVAPTLTEIKVKTPPTKTVYTVGDSFDQSGLALTATYSDGNTQTVTGGFTCSGYHANETGVQTIEVTYQGLKTSFTVTVNPKATTLYSIEVTKYPTKTTYYVGDTLDTAGMEVTAKYSDNSTKTVTGWMCSPTKLNTKGTQKITVTYTEGGVSQTDTFDVTVTEKEPDPEVTFTSIKVTKSPTKTVYEIGEALDTAGIEITATYSDGSTKTISASGCAFTGFDSGSAGTKTVTVTYQRKTDQFTVTVKQVDPTSDGQIYIDPAKGYIGQKVNVTIRMQNNPGLVAAKLAIGYDANVLKLVDAKNGEVFTGGSFVTSETIATNPYVAMWSDSIATTDYTADGVLLTLSFEVLETAAKGTTEITATYEPSATFNHALQDQTLVMHNGSIDITQRVSGDADGDGVLTLKDVVVMRRMLARWEGYSINDANADVDGDGKVTLKDATLIERYLADWEVTLK